MHYILGLHVVYTHTMLRPRLMYSLYLKIIQTVPSRERLQMSSQRLTETPTLVNYDTFSSTLLDDSSLHRELILEA